MDGRCNVMNPFGSSFDLPVQTAQIVICAAYRRAGKVCPVSAAAHPPNPFLPQRWIIDRSDCALRSHIRRLNQPAPRRLGPWLLERVIGRGSMSTIYQGARPTAADSLRGTPSKCSMPRCRISHGGGVLLPRGGHRPSRFASAPGLRAICPDCGAAVLPGDATFIGGTAEERLGAASTFRCPTRSGSRGRLPKALDAVHRAGYLHGDVEAWQSDVIE